MASIQDALKKSAERTAKTTSRNRGLRPYDVINENAEKQIKEDKPANTSVGKADIEQSTKEAVKNDPSALEQVVEITHSTQNIVIKNDVATEFRKPSETKKQEISIDESCDISPEDELFLNIDPETKQERLAEELIPNEVKSIGESYSIETKSSKLTPLISENKNLDEVDFEQLLDEATEEAAIKAVKEHGVVGVYDEYIEEKGWNKVPHSLQKWVLKKFKGNDLKGMYYFSYLAIRNRSAVFSAGYSNIADALGIKDKKTGPKRIIKSLIEKGVLSIDAEPTPYRPTAYKLIPIETLLKQEPEFFKRVLKDEPVINKDIESEASVLRKYLEQHYSTSEVSRVIPKYKYVLEKYSVQEVISVIDHVSNHSVFGIEKIGNVNSFLLSGDPIGDTFVKAFNSITNAKSKTNAIEEKMKSEANEALLKKQEDELFKFKAEQARQFIFIEGEDAGKLKLEELKVKYRVENKIASNIPIVDNAALVYFYDSMASTKS